MRTYKGPLKTLPRDSVFVFGSNTQGRHGKGAALWAKQNAGAIYGNPKGRQGNSYAIITKDLTRKVHPSITETGIVRQIWDLYDYANLNKDKDFYIAYMDKPNLNGYTSKQMAMFFCGPVVGTIPDNIIFEESFAKLF